MTKTMIEPDQPASLAMPIGRNGPAFVRGVRLMLLAAILAAIGFGFYLLNVTPDMRAAPLEGAAALLAALGVPVLRLLNQPPSTAYWLLLFGLLGFALITPWWTGETMRRYRAVSTSQPVGLRTVWWTGALALALALGALWTAARGDDALWLWLAALGIAVAVAWQLDRARPGVAYGEAYRAQVSPQRGWPLLLVMLAIFAALYSVGLRDLPLRIDAQSAEVGLLARQWLAGEGDVRQQTGGDSPPVLVVLQVAALLRAIPDGVLALRLAGVLNAVALLAAIWLAGSELFRRTPHVGAYGEVYEDDGSWMALLAVMATGVTIPMMQAARMPVPLAVAGAGVLGLWALLRGLRQDRRGLVGGSGLLLGLALTYGVLGAWFVATGLMVWLGGFLLAREWLVGRTLHPRPGTAPVTVQQGAGWPGVAIWLAGMVIGSATLIGGWIAQPERWQSYWQWSGSPVTQQWWPDQLQTALLGLAQFADRSGVYTGDTAFLHSLLGVVLVLALGALLFNLDSLPGWVLVTWLGVGLIGMSMTVPNLPDWAAYVVVLPAAGLAVAFGLDRLRVLLMVTLGSWTLQATVYLALGVLLIAGFFGWIDFNQHAARDVDIASTVGRVLAEQPAGSVVLVNGTTDMAAVAGGAVVRFLTWDGDGDVRVVTMDDLDGLATGTRVLFAPSDWYLALQAVDMAPARELTILRDVRANPLLYMVEIP